MKLSDHVERIRLLIDSAFRSQLGRMGITAKSVAVALASAGASIGAPAEARATELLNILKVLSAETGDADAAFEKLVEELTFTLFNRIAALKAMEAHTLHPEIVTRRAIHGDRSFAHKLWLEQNPEQRNEELEGLVAFWEEQLDALSAEIPLFSLKQPYHLTPTPFELIEIFDAFNDVEKDPQVALASAGANTNAPAEARATDVWTSDDILGWLYESYNNYKKIAHKDSKEKTEYHKVSIQSQVYTPRWVVKFLVDNSLGKLYLEMFPNSDVRNRYAIANAPDKPTRTPKPLKEIKLIDPACGSGNFLLYAFDFFYELYQDQIENYGLKLNPDKIAETIIENNLHGIDIDDRAVQLAQLGLYIKAKRKKKQVKIRRFNVVSSDFFLPPYEEVKHLFEADGQERLSPELEKIVVDLWRDLQTAHKFGSLVRLEEKFSLRMLGLVQQFNEAQLKLYSVKDLADYAHFRENFFNRLELAVALNTEREGVNFLNFKTADAITFLQLLTQKYDVAAANPPYTDSSDFGEKLKTFIDANYKEPYKFNTNLYATFIKRCCELTNERGFVALIHPHTFMFIKTFEDVRKYLIKHTHIDIMVDYGLDRVNLFGTGILLDATWYVLSKQPKETPGVYFNITANQQEKAKQASLEQAYQDFIHNQKNERVFTMPQEKLKIIEGWPFIYWISDGFREKFKGDNLKKYFEVGDGLKTSNNLKYFRNILEINIHPESKYITITKGGPDNKWAGNIWMAIDFWGQKANISKESSSRFTGEANYFKEGIVCSSVGTGGTTFRLKPSNTIFSNADLGIFFKQSSKSDDYGYLLSLLNSKLVRYINGMLNPTVNITAGDILRIPFVLPPPEIEKRVSELALDCIETKKRLNEYSIIETNYARSPLVAFAGQTLTERALNYLYHENDELTRVLQNEAEINELIFEVYALSPEDRAQVEAKMGVPVGSVALASVALALAGANTLNAPAEARATEADFLTLYQSNNDLEEFCVKRQLNPVDVSRWFRESGVLPPARAAEIALDFLTDAIRAVLLASPDGIVSLTAEGGEKRLLDRLEEHCVELGFSLAQFRQLEGLLGRGLDDYLQNHFFKNLSDRLNLFMYLPKTPFIWHVSSGEAGGFDAYLIIYKWTEDNLYKLKNRYLSNRTESLNFRLQDLSDVESAAAQTERETIRRQLQEIDSFAEKIDDLLASGYRPQLDDGVGKNIAPLQKRGMLRTEVLNKKQLEKYLNADW